MDLHASLDAVRSEIAGAAADASDLPALARLQEHLLRLADAATRADRTALVAAAREAADGVERIILREVEDAPVVLKALGASIEAAAESLEHRARRDPALVRLWLDRARTTRDEVAAALDRDDGEAEDALRALAEESLALRIPEAAEICDRAARDLADELDPGRRDRAVRAALRWLEGAEAALAGSCDGALPSTAPDRETALREATRSIANALKARPGLDARVDDDRPLVLRAPEDAETFASFLSESREHLESADQALLAIERARERGGAGSDREPIHALFRAFHTIKGVAGFLGLGPIVDVTHAAETLLDELREGRRACSRSAVDRLLVARDALERLLDAAAGTTAVRTGDLRRWLAAIGERVASMPAAPANGGSDGEIVVRADAVAHRPVEATVKVATSRLDALLDQVGELVVAQLMVAQDPAIAGVGDPTTHGVLAHLARTVRDLQSTATGLRMVTLRTLFQRMARLVGELARASGKRIELSLSGEDTELDRRIVEELGDPLVHMLRNACDHGVEPPEERIAAGKPPVGRIALEASHAGGTIRIAISDDGRGLDRDRILARARRCGLLGADRRDDEISDAEAFALVFRPGFSTAERVTELSGRGVGMDVVKRGIESLRGSIGIESTHGAGTRFTIRLPLTLAIIDGTVVRVGAERFVVPTEAVVAPVLLPEGDALRLPSGSELARCRGEWLPLRRIAGASDGMRRRVDERPLVLVLETPGRRYALAVDEVLGRQQAVIKSVGSGPWVDPIVAGGTILGDGRVALILDVAALASTRTRGELADRSLAAGAQT